MNPEKSFSLKVSQDSVNSFVICLAIGTLTAIKEGVLPPESGIWTLGRPCFWLYLEHTSSVSSTVLEILQTADELDALYKLRGIGEMNQAIENMLIKLKSELKKCSEESWYAG